MKKQIKRKKSKKKIDKYVGRRMAALAIIVLVIFIIINIICGGDKNKEKKLKLLIDNVETTYADIIVDYSDKIYFSVFDLTNIFDSNLYYNDAEKELITTFNRHVALLKVDETFMVVNDTNVNLSTSVKELNNTVYVPIKDMEIVYDIEVTYSKDENILMLDSIDKSKKVSTLLKKAKLKEDKGLFEKTIEKVEDGQKVIIIDSQDKYYKVRTEKGNIGYINKNKLSEIESIRDDFNIEKLPVNILNNSNEIKKQENINLKDSHLNVLNPAVVKLDSNSEIAKNAVVGTDSFKEYVNWANENNIYIMPTLKNTTSVSSNFMTYAKRNKFINELYVFLVKNGVKGVYVDFEDIDDLNSFYRFLIELTPKFRESGLYVIVENNKLLDKEKLESIVDYVVEEK